MNNPEYYSTIEILKIVKDLIVGLIWPTIVLIIIFLFKEKITIALHNLAIRFQKTKEIKLPGGIQAFFLPDIESKSEELSVEILKELNENVDEAQIERISSKIKQTVIQEEYKSLILNVISMHGFISRENLYTNLKVANPFMENTETEKTIKYLIDNELIIEESGRLNITQKGVSLSRKYVI